MKIGMFPVPNAKNISGIQTVINAWAKHFPDHGMEIVDPRSQEYDVLAVHAGAANSFPQYIPVVSHLHGLYWTADYRADSWEWAVNRFVVESIRVASEVTVPSAWVAETLQRDTRINPTVIHHGVDIEEWEHNFEPESYVLGYAKNRSYMDVCNPVFLTSLANKFPDLTFVSTFEPPNAPPNIKTIGVIPHNEMKEIIQKALVVISPIKETFGVLTLEAMASHIPVLGYNYGGNKELIRHGENGYLAGVNNIDDLAVGLDYCLRYRKQLGDNGRELAKQYNWDVPCSLLSMIYQRAMQPEKPTIGVVIPSYNYASKLADAIESVQKQELKVDRIVVVDDGSTDNGETERLVTRMMDSDDRIYYLPQANSGVAVARNRGIENCPTKYIICLDADDRIDPSFTDACFSVLENDRDIGIAYTGLMAVMPDGTSTQSNWPPDFNYDKMVYAEPKGINQIPTCCMFRRVIWERLGGYRQRYAPDGAGSEDAEFWLRAGAYGFKAKKVTPAPLFLYSFRSGNVSGNKAYREVDWHIMHPWSVDKEHPITSIATPANNRQSHAVRQYDNPVISVVIPVGHGHKDQVFNALDSLEAQSFRKWEAIIVDDTGDNQQWSFDGVTDMLSSYPYIRYVKTPGKKGAGYARNRGVDVARGSMILFLDADDNLVSQNALRSFIDVWNREGQIPYSDYLGTALIDDNVELKKLSDAGRLHNYNNKSKFAVLRHTASDYDCERAIVQPRRPLYIWNLITSLVPKEWHYEIGGFDERMPSWEDWLYWLMLARRGKCFIRIAEPLVMYRFYTGSRRDDGIKQPTRLLQYIEKRLEEVETMPCNCGGRKVIQATIHAQEASNRTILTMEKTNMINQINDNDMILITYMNPNRGMHKVIGHVTKIDYRYRVGGGQERFLVHRDDVAAQPNFFIPYREKEIIIPEQARAVPPPPPTSISKISEKVEDDFDETREMYKGLGILEDEDELDLQNIPGITKGIADQLIDRGWNTANALLSKSIEELMELDGIGESRAKMILNYVNKK